MGENLLRQSLVGDGKSKQAAEAQIVVSFYQVALGDGFEAYDLDNLADIVD